MLLLFRIQGYCTFLLSQSTFFVLFPLSVVIQNRFHPQSLLLLVIVFTYTFFVSSTGLLFFTLYLELILLPLYTSQSLLHTLSEYTSVCLFVCLYVRQCTYLFIHLSNLFI